MHAMCYCTRYRQVGKLKTMKKTYKAMAKDEEDREN